MPGAGPPARTGAGRPLSAAPPPAPGGSGPATLAGRAVYRKHRRDAPPGFFATEAWGLRWLRAAGAVAVPEVRWVGDDGIAVELVATAAPSAAAAEGLGRQLADLHAAGAERFGAPVPGFIGPLPMDNGDAPTWWAFYLERRVLPFLAAAVDRRALEREGARRIEAALGRWEALGGTWAGEPPSRLHGDLWAGNLLWGADGRGWLIDPAAHGGHRETDLAMLALFPPSHLATILAAYHEHRPLAEGWRQRVGLHQLHPLLVHAVLFGPHYGARAVAVAGAGP